MRSRSRRFGYVTGNTESGLLLTSTDESNRQALLLKASYKANLRLQFGIQIKLSSLLLE